MGSYRTLLAAGSNAKGQLGIGSYDDAHTFTPCQFTGCEPDQLPDPSATVAHVACGANHTALLLRHLDGSTTLWGAGDGGRGQLGPAYPHESFEPGPSSRLGPAPQTIFRALDVAPRGYTYKLVAAAWETTYVVLARPGCSDTLLSMGSNAFGALGVGDGSGNGNGNGNGAEGAAGPHVVAFDHVFLDDPGVRTGTLCVRSLHAGPRHVVAQLAMTRLKADGSDSESTSPLRARTRSVLVGWGVSRHGQLGANVNGVKDGGARFVARPIRLPIDVDEDPMVACALGNRHTVVLHASGRISALGSDRQGQIPSLGGRKHICGLGCTWNGTYMQAVEGNGHVLLSMGSNSQGQLGRGDAMGEGTVNLPVDSVLSHFVCGSEHVLTTVTSSSQEGSSVVGWGWNEHGNMGLGSMGDLTTPTQLWPRKDIETYNKFPQRVIDIWAGCATSWLLVE